MAQFPVSDDQNLQEAVNQLLSGPAGLGQNFKGFSAYTLAYLTGNYRPPFTSPTYEYAVTGNIGEYTIIVNPNANGLIPGMIVSGYGFSGLPTIVSVDGPLVDGIQLTLSIANPIDQDTFATFSPPVIPLTYVAPIALSTCEQLDSRTYKFTFATPQPSPPFVPGNGPTVSGNTVDWYNDSWTTPGITECTTDYVIVTGNSYHTPIEPTGTGGTIEYYITTNNDDPTYYTFNSTDCNAKVLVNGVSDRVFIAAQIENTIYFTNTTPGTFYYTVSIRRYRGRIETSNPTNPDYRFSSAFPIFQKTYLYEEPTSPIGPVNTIFTSIIDTPGPGYYWYILDIAYNGVPAETDYQVTSSEFTVRSLSAQVVKQ